MTSDLQTDLLSQKRVAFELTEFKCGNASGKGQQYGIKLHAEVNG